MREIILDTETTGLDPFSGHRLVEIGALELINRMPTGRTYHQYINPERSMPEEAFRVHGISEAFLKDKPLFREIAEDFLSFVEGGTLVIHNAPFDMKFINAELDWIGKPAISMETVIDTLAMARKKFPGAKNNLDALCRRFNVSNAHRTLHGALLDSELLLDVYLELNGGRQLGFSLANKGSHVEVSQMNTIEKTESSINATFLGDWLTLVPTEEELKAHNDMVKEIPDALWKKA